MVTHQKILRAEYASRYAIKNSAFNWLLGSFNRSRKVEANRRNNRKSCGPRTAVGKSTASRNALRHGFAALTHGKPMPAPEVEQIARAICGDDNDPLLFAQALEIAENEMTLLEIRAHQVHVIERLREPYDVALSKKDNSLDLGLARYMEGMLAVWEIEKQLPKVLEKYREQMGLADAPAPKNPAPWADELLLMPETLAYYKATDRARYGPWDMLVPIRLKAIGEEQEADEQILELARKRVKELERDEYEALEAAILDLMRLDRYERRAWSRQKRAIREFMKIKAASRIEPGERGAA